MIANLSNANARKIKGDHTHSAKPYRIGERVQNSRFGKGVVLGFNPNGTIIVHFDGQKKNQYIFPTFLEKNTH